MRNYLTFLKIHSFKKTILTFVLKLLATIQTVPAILYLDIPVLTTEYPQTLNEPVMSEFQEILIPE